MLFDLVIPLWTYSQGKNPKEGAFFFFTKTFIAALFIRVKNWIELKYLVIGRSEVNHVTWIYRHLNW